MQKEITTIVYRCDFCYLPHNEVKMLAIKVRPELKYSGLLSNELDKGDMHICERCLDKLQIEWPTYTRLDKGIDTTKL